MKLINFLMNNPCQDPNILKVILFIRKIMEVAFIAIPIVLIVLITFDFVKSVMAGTEDAMKKNQKIVIKRLIYAVMLFFVLPIVNIVFGAFTSSEQADLIGEEFGKETVNYLTCWTNAKEDLIEEFEKTVTFDGNGGNVYGDSKKTCGGKEVCQITSFPRATKSGYKFYGWSLTKQDVCTEYVNEIYLYEKETTYYACFASEGNEPVEEDATPDLEKLQKESNEKSNASGFWWPIEAGDDGNPKTTTISSYYGTRTYNGETSTHLGIDIKEGNTPKIIASYDGKVYKMAKNCQKTTSADYGTYVALEHDYNGETFYTIYGHMTCGSIPESLRVGVSVKAGDMLGTMGNTGYSSGQHLHFEMRKGAWSKRVDHAVNPLDYVSISNPYPMTLNYTDTSKTKTMLVNEWNVIEKDSWKPNKLEKVGAEYVVDGYENIQLQTNAAAAVRKLIDAAKKDGVNLKVRSGYRSFDAQNKLEWQTNPLIAAPNATEHRTGLAVDFNEATNWGKWINKYEKEWDWLCKNARNYGFILRYPLGAGDKTGIHGESWHWRYIGKDVAIDFYEKASKNGTATLPNAQQSIQSSDDEKTKNMTVYYKYTYEEYYETYIK